MKFFFVSLLFLTTVGLHAETLIATQSFKSEVMINTYDSKGESETITVSSKFFFLPNAAGIIRTISCSTLKGYEGGLLTIKRKRFLTISVKRNVSDWLIGKGKGKGNTEHYRKEFQTEAECFAEFEKLDNHVTSVENPLTIEIGAPGEFQKWK